MRRLPRRRRDPLGLLRRELPGVLADAAVTMAAFYCASLLRLLDAQPADLERAVTSLDRWIGPLVVLYVGMNYAWRLNRRVWRYARAPEVLAISLSVGGSTLIALLADLVLSSQRLRLVPLSVVLLGGFFTLTGMVLTRYRSRLILGRSRSRGDRRRIRTLIYGAGETGAILAWRLLTERESELYQVVGFVDDDPAKRGRRIHGLDVLGSRAELYSLTESNRVDLIVLAMARVSGEDLREVLAAAQQTSAQIKIVPGLLELLNGPEASRLLREVRVEDLLGRQPVVVDRHACEAIIRGRCVLITGAAGSVGSELCRQVCVFAPSRLVLLDNNESGLYDLGVDLRLRFPELVLELLVGDVTQAGRVEHAFRLFRPQVIFHAAAYKHVPLMERFPEEAFRVNVLGTRNVLEAARRHASDFFVLVSTDKAVNPRSVMGATKRLAEMLVLAASADVADGKPLCTTVRFGNVLGSRGSVVPTFTRQIDAGGPVTVTHPEMTRYFMDPAEAASLIVQAASLTDGGDVFMLDMGERIRIDDLARRMIRMRGLRPDVDVPVVYTGIRPGEKLHEELTLAGEERLATVHPLIHRVSGVRRIAGSWLEQRLERLAGLAVPEGRRELREQLMELSAFDERLRRAEEGWQVGRPAQPKVVPEPPTIVSA